jgi:hypothetical protein
LAGLTGQLHEGAELEPLNGAQPPSGTAVLGAYQRFSEAPVGGWSMARPSLRWPPP